MSEKPLSELTNAELSEVFAVEVAGFKDDPVFPLCFWVSPDGKAHHKTTEFGHTFSLFADSADAVLPYLEKCLTWHLAFCAGCTQGGYSVFVRSYDGALEIEAEGKTLARAACIALITAKRAEKEASKA